MGKIPPEKLRKVTRSFNRFRFPEVKAKVMENREGLLKVKFTGVSAPFSCCFDENFIDYAYYVKDETSCELELISIKRKRLNEFIVIYKVKKQS